MRMFLYSLLKLEVSSWIKVLNVKIYWTLLILKQKKFTRCIELVFFLAFFFSIFLIWSEFILLNFFQVSYYYRSRSIAQELWVTLRGENKGSWSCLFLELKSILRFLSVPHKKQASPNYTHFNGHQSLYLLST